MRVLPLNWPGQRPSTRFTATSTGPTPHTTILGFASSHMASTCLRAVILINAPVLERAERLALSHRSLLRGPSSVDEDLKIARREVVLRHRPGHRRRSCLFPGVAKKLKLRAGAKGALDLGAVQDPASVGIEGVAAVHRRAVIPQHQVAWLPLVAPGKFVSRGVSP